MNLRAVDTPAVGRYEATPPDLARQGQSGARREGFDFDEIALDWLQTAGAEIVATRLAVGAVGIDAHIRGANGKQFWVLAHGNVDVESTSRHPGLTRSDTIRKAGASAALLHRRMGAFPVLLVTSHLPDPNRAAGKWLAELRFCLFDVVSVNGDLAGYQRVLHYLTATPAPQTPLVGEWMHAIDEPSFDSCGQWRRHA